ncbi:MULTISPECIES: hypothetical protein [unclassified Streptomyces]|uniref:hypothetical protein n=1 Tax=Streptomyces sp. 021-4 TaxID=2789260 RepID=UPI0039F44B63
MTRLFRAVHRIDSHRKTLGVPPERREREEGYRAGLLAAAAISRGAPAERGPELYAVWLRKQGTALAPCDCQPCTVVGEALARLEADPHAFDKDWDEPSPQRDDQRAEP